MNTPSVADIANAMLTVSHLRISIENGKYIYVAEDPAPNNLAAASELINATTSEMMQLGKWLIQYPLENLPARKRLKAYRRFREQLELAETPMHAKQKALEQVTAKSIKQLASENQFS